MLKLLMIHWIVFSCFVVELKWQHVLRMLTTQFGTILSDAVITLALGNHGSKWLGRASYAWFETITSQLTVPFLSELLFVNIKGRGRKKKKENYIIGMFCSDVLLPLSNVYYVMKSLVWPWVIMDQNDLDVMGGLPYITEDAEEMVCETPEAACESDGFPSRLSDS
ncbi:hypothetical protein LOK49_Contig220G00003 [Camellia lanceoleosa]|nr:hypothetical protein LOK49_Contig220G00003 [Camellia lanceoleosa]